MNRILGVVAALAIAVPLSSCSSGGKASMSGPESGAAAKPAPGGFYAEESVKGRTYVFGTEKSYDRFKKTGEVPAIAVTFIGAGTSGETVVLEADGKDPSVQERLKSGYNQRHTPKLP